MADYPKSVEELLGNVRVPGRIELDCSKADKGINNYQVDVSLSGPFVFRTRELVDEQLKRIIAGKRLIGPNSSEMGELREAYTDMMRVTLHRSKTDFSLDQIRILQFGALKFVYGEVMQKVDKYGSDLENTLAEQREMGTRTTLITQEKLTWFRQYRDDFLFGLNRSMTRALLREETNVLRDLRDKVLGNELREAVNVMFNPMLMAATPHDAPVLVEFYTLWPGGEPGYTRMNETVEKTMSAAFPEFEVTALKGSATADVEPHDEFRGFIALQNLLGSTPNQNQTVSEEFCWLDEPGHVRLLFDETLHERNLELIRDNEGRKAQWAYKFDIKRFSKVFGELKKKLLTADEFKLLAASYVARDKYDTQDIGLIKASDAARCIAGIESEKILAAIDTQREGGQVLKDKLRKGIEEFKASFAKDKDDMFLRILTDYSRYRLHLKYFRFAQRVFNRIHVIHEAKEIRLAQAGGNLYKLMDSDELKAIASDTPEIVHHTILKADVRGSTTVTTELLKKKLNPASYFSLHFFEPINEKLKQYGVEKVFIEGDAVILATYEYEGKVSEWYAVSRACGMAKEMLDIVKLKNASAARSELPHLEIGIGICYADSSPLFLFDEKRPIMISSAIGDADRLSGCSWRLRESLHPGDFNVEVVFPAATGQDEKGQKLERYNVNGIVLDGPAFEKLQGEIKLKSMRLKVREQTETFYIGKFPDLRLKERSLVVRVGQVGHFQDGRVVNRDASAMYYEVLPNSKLATQLIGLSDKDGFQETA